MWNFSYMVSIRVAAAQINTTVGDIRGNVDLINEYINYAIRMDADIVAFPELTVPGYPPEDLVWRRDYVKANQDALNEIAKTSKKGAKVGDIFLFDITSTVCSKFIILPGIA